MKLYLVVLACLFAGTFSAPVSETGSKTSNAIVSTDVKIKADSEETTASDKVAHSSSSTAAPTEAPVTEESNDEESAASEAPKSEDKKDDASASTETVPEKATESAATEAADTDESTNEVVETKTDEIKSEAPQTTETPQKETNAESMLNASDVHEEQKEEPAKSQPSVLVSCSGASNEAHQETKVDEVKVEAPKPIDVLPVAAVSGRSRGRGSVKYSDTKVSHYENDVSYDGSYKYSYADDAGSSVNQEGAMKQIDDETSGNSVKGGYSYKDDEGNDFSITYTADENGYRPVGDHLPVAPEIPPAIARALAFLATAKPWVDPSVVPKSAKKAKHLDIASSEMEIAVKSGEVNKETAAESKSVEIVESAPLAVNKAPVSTDAPAAVTEPLASIDSRVTTEAPAASTSESLSSEAPASEAPASEAPASEAPASEAPASEAPVSSEATSNDDNSSSEAPSSSETASSADSAEQSTTAAAQSDENSSAASTEASQ